MGRWLEGWPNVDGDLWYDIAVGDTGVGAGADHQADLGRVRL